MTIKKMKLFGFQEGWPWWLVLAITTTATVQAFNYNYITTNNHIPAGGIVAILTTLAAFWGISIWRYICRYNFIQTIVGYTKDGVAIILGDKVKSYQNIQKTIDDAGISITQTIAFWRDWYESNAGLKYRYSQEPVIAPVANSSKALEDAFNGAFLVIVDDPFIPKSATGPMAIKMPKLLGMQLGQTLVAVWQSGHSFIEATNIIKHEAGHLALEALEIPGGELGKKHHEIFNQSGYGV